MQVLRLRSFGEFQLAVTMADPADPDSPDVLEVRIEAAASEQAALAARVLELVQRLVQVRAEVRCVAPGSIFDPMRNIEARRFVDERKH